MVAQPVTDWLMSEKGYPACVLESATGVLVGTKGMEPLGEGWYKAGRRTGTQRPLWRYDGEWHDELGTVYDGVVGLAEDAGGLWAVAYRVASEGVDVHLLRKGDVWASLASWHEQSVPAQGKLLVTSYGVFIQTDLTRLWRGVLGVCGSSRAALWERDGALYALANEPIIKEWQGHGSNVYWVVPNGEWTAGGYWRRRYWVLVNEGPERNPIVAVHEGYVGGLVERARLLTTIPYSEPQYLGATVVPAPDRLYAYVQSVRSVWQAEEFERVARWLSWDGRRLVECGPPTWLPVTEGACGKDSGWFVGMAIDPEWLQLQGQRWLSMSEGTLDRGYTLLRVPAKLWLFSLSVDWGDGRGEHRPKLSGLRLDYRPSRRWDNKPTMRGLSVDWSDGSGSHKPKLDSLAVQYSDGAGEHRPALTSLSVEYEAEGTAGTERPRLRRLEVDWATRRGWVGEGERVLVLKPIEAPEGEWWALHVHTNLTREQEEQCRLLVRKEPSDRPVDDWESYRTYRLGWRVYLPVAAGSVRVAVVGPDTLPDDVEVFAQFVR